MLRIGRASRYIVLASLFCASVARADEIQFNNGDKLTGTILSAEGGKLKFKSKMAGTVELDMADIKTFSTDKPVAMKFEDGTIVKQEVAAGADGQVGVKAGAVQAQNFPIKSIKYINQNENWTGTLVAGALITRGNSDTDAFNISFDITRRTDNDRFNINGQYLFGRQRDQDSGEKTTSTDNWRLGAKYDYFLTKQLYAFGSFGIERDRIANLDLRLTPAVGLGYQWVESKTFNFSTEGGIAWVYEEYNNDGTNDTISLKLAYHVDKELREGIKVFHNLAYYPSLERLDDYYLLTDAGLRVELTEKMFAEFKMEFKYDATPAPDSSRSDLRYILGVGWTF